MDNEKKEIPHNKEEMPWEHYLSQYAKADPEEIAGRCQLEYDEEKGGFAIRMMGVDYRVSHPDFQVTTDHEGYAALRDTLYPAKILVARFLLEGKILPEDGGFVTYRDVPWGEHYFGVFQGRCIKRLAFSYGGKIAQFCQLMDAIGATPVSTGDAGYRFPFINNVEMQFILWSGDEEFPPSAQILFADNAIHAFSAEDMAFMGDISIGTLKAMEREQKST